MIRLKVRSSAVLIACVLLCAFITSVFSSRHALGADDTCALSVSEPLVDYGRTTRDQLLKGALHQRQVLLGKRTFTLNAVCETKAEREIVFRGEAVDDSRFRFGQHGTFSLRVLSAQLDGRPVRMVSSSAVGTSRGSASSLLRPGVGLIPYEGSKVASGERLSLQVEVETYVDSKDTRARSEETWEGGGSFDINRLN